MKALKECYWNVRVQKCEDGYFWEAELAQNDSGSEIWSPLRGQNTFCLVQNRDVDYKNKGDCLNNWLKFVRLNGIVNYIIM